MPKNSVGTKQLRNLSVTRTKIRGDAVDSGKVRNRSLKAIDFKLGQLPSGAKGDKGDKGDTGSKGAPGISGYELVAGKPVALAANGGTVLVTIICPTGKKAVGGGASHSAVNVGYVAYMTASYPDPGSDGERWIVGYKNPSATPATVSSYAACAFVAG